MLPKRFQLEPLDSAVHAATLTEMCKGRASCKPLFYRKEIFRFVNFLRSSQKNEDKRVPDGMNERSTSEEGTKKRRD